MRVSTSVSEADLDTELEPGLEGAEEEEGETEQSEPELEEDTMPEPDDTEALTYSEQNGADDAEDELELPPPMKPITEPILVATANGSSESAIATESCGKSLASFIFLLAASNIFPLVSFLFFLPGFRSRSFLFSSLRFPLSF